MKEGWEYSTIGDLCDKMNGLWKGKKGPFVNVGVIRNANFTKTFTLSYDNIEYLDVEAKQYETRKLQKGDLIVEKSGGSEKQPVGRTVLFDKEDGEYSFSNFTSVLRIKDKSIVTPEFLYKYILFVYLRGDTRKMQKATTGIHNIEFDKYLAIPVPKLTLSEQQRIVEYLDSAFAKIDAMKANAEKSLNEAKALFQASLKEMLEPKEGWKEKTLKEICVFSQGVQVPLSNQSMTKEYGFTRFLRIIDFTQGGELPRYVPIVDKKYWMKKDEVAIVRYGASAGYICTGLEGTLANNLFKVSIKSNENLSSKYLVWWLRSDAFQSIIKKIMNGAAMPAISFGMINNISLIYPPLSEQQSIVATLDSLKSKVDRLQSNFEKISQECDALKQSILRQVFE